MQIREILDLMESIENQQDTTAEKGLDALEDVLANTLQLINAIPDPKSLKQNKPVPTQNSTSIEEGKFSTGLISLAFAGLSALGAGGAQAQQTQQELLQDMAFCTGFLVKASESMNKMGREFNRPELVRSSATAKAHADNLTRMVKPLLNQAEFSKSFGPGYNSYSVNGTGQATDIMKACMNLVKNLSDSTAEVQQRRAAPAAQPQQSKPAATTQQSQQPQQNQQAKIVTMRDKNNGTEFTGTVRDGGVWVNGTLKMDDGRTFKVVDGKIKS